MAIKLTTKQKKYASVNAKIATNWSPSVLKYSPSRRKLESMITWDDVVLKSIIKRNSRKNSLAISMRFSAINILNQRNRR